MPDRLSKNIQSHDALRAAIANAMPLSNRLDGLFLGGNYGRGTQDQWSDLDYIAVAEPEHATCIAIVWFDLLRKLAPPVVMYRQGNQQILINIVTKD